MTASVVGIADGRALGCSMRVIVTHPDSLVAAKRAVEEMVAAVDAAASHFRRDSELSLVNSRPDLVIKVSPLLARAIAAAMRGAELTNGAVDPTVGSGVRLSDSALVVERIPGWRAIRFSESARTIVIPRTVELDLGATGKAFAADMAAEAASRVITRGGVLVSLGGDIAVAGEAPPGGWPIQASEDSGAPISDDEETISITSGGVATSGVTLRDHIIDPATGRPVDGPWRTVSVAAGSCVDANIASTAAFVLGEPAIEWLGRRGLPARLVDRAGVIHRVAGWPAPADSQPALKVL